MSADTPLVKQEIILIFQEAIKTHKPIQRAGWGDWYIVKIGDLWTWWRQYRNFRDGWRPSIEDSIAVDWQVIEGVDTDYLRTIYDTPSARPISERDVLYKRHITWKHHDYQWENPDWKNHKSWIPDISFLKTEE